MTLWKHSKRLWTLLTTEEVFDEHCSIGRQSVVRGTSRGQGARDHMERRFLPLNLGSFCSPLQARESRPRRRRCHTGTSHTQMSHTQFAEATL